MVKESVYCSHMPRKNSLLKFKLGRTNLRLDVVGRALLTDLSGDDSNTMRRANGFYSFFTAVGDVLGFSAGAYTNLHSFLAFTRTTACDVYCANLKTCFFISAALLLSLTAVALASVSEPPPSPDDTSSSSSSVPFFGEMARALRELQRPMWIHLLVTCLNWVAWFPFLLFDTDWMGKEVYGGEVGAEDPAKARMYDRGVHAGTLGLMLNSVVLGFMSLGVEPLTRLLGGPKRLWGLVNFVLAACLASTVIITKMAQAARRAAGPAVVPPADSVKGSALTLFSALGVPLAVTYSDPFAIFSNTAGAGQGLSLGVLNLAIVVPQMVVSAASGPWDALFGGSNLPAFVVGAIAAAASGILALTLLPSPPGPSFPSEPAFH